MNERSMGEYVAGAPANTDDHPRVEYSQWHDKRTNFDVIKVLVKSKVDELEDTVAFLSKTGGDGSWRRIQEQMEAKEFARKGEIFGWMGMVPENVELYRIALSIFPEDRHVRHLAFRALGEMGIRPE
jgi:hypothetical protein